MYRLLKFSNRNGIVGVNIWTAAKTVEWSTSVLFHNAWWEIEMRNFFGRQHLLSFERIRTPQIYFWNGKKVWFNNQREFLVNSWKPSAIIAIIYISSGKWIAATQMTIVITTCGNTEQITTQFSPGQVQSHQHRSISVTSSSNDNHIFCASTVKTATEHSFLCFHYIVFIPLNAVDDTCKSLLEC